MSNITQVHQIFGLRVLIRRIEQASRTMSGIMLPDSDQKLNLGIVIAIGDGERKNGEMITVNPSIKVCDTVVFQKYGGTEVMIKEDGVMNEYIIVNSTDILANVTLENEGKK